MTLYRVLSFKDFIYLFLERGKKGERKGEKHQCVLASPCPLLGTWPTTQACALDWESNQQSFGSQAHTQYTEVHQPRPMSFKKTLLENLRMKNQ